MDVSWSHVSTQTFIRSSAIVLHRFNYFPLSLCYSPCILTQRNVSAGNCWAVTGGWVQYNVSRWRHMRLECINDDTSYTLSMRNGRLRLQQTRAQTTHGVWLQTCHAVPTLKLHPSAITVIRWLVWACRVRNWNRCRKLLFGLQRNLPRENDVFRVAFVSGKVKSPATEWEISKWWVSVRFCVSVRSGLDLVFKTMNQSDF